MTMHRAIQAPKRDSQTGRAARLHEKMFQKMNYRDNKVHIHLRENGSACTVRNRTVRLYGPQPLDHIMTVKTVKQL